MQITDTIADLLTRIRNANSAKHDSVEIPASNLKKSICQILLDEGYIKNFTVIEDGKQGVIKVTLKYVDMLRGFAFFFVSFYLGPFLRKREAVQEFLPYYFHGRRTWMHEVFRIESIVAQLVQHYLVGRKIWHSALLERYVQQALAERISMRAE